MWNLVYCNTRLVWKFGDINVFLELWAQMFQENLGTPWLAIKLGGTLCCIECGNVQSLHYRFICRWLPRISSLRARLQQWTSERRFVGGQTNLIVMTFTAIVRARLWQSSLNVQNQVSNPTCHWLKQGRTQKFLKGGGCFNFSKSNQYQIVVNLFEPLMKIQHYYLQTGFRSNSCILLRLFIHFFPVITILKVVGCEDFIY